MTVPTVSRDGLLAPDVSSYSARRWYLQVSPDRPPEWRKLAFPDLAGIAVSDDRVSLWEAVARIFYIRNYSDPGDREDGLPVLCMEELAKDAMLTRCLVEGVENMQLELGIDTDGDSVANRYVSPAEVRDYVGAVSTRVSLLLRSVYPVAGLRDTRIYRLGPSRVSAPGDGHLRRVFSTTVELRNRLRRPIHVVKGADNEPV